MDDRNVKIGVGMMLRQAAEFGEAQAERRANDLDMRLQVALLENQELRSHIVELEAQLSRGVFVREMSDEEILATWHRLSSEGPRYRDAGADLCKRTVRACIAAATKLPEVSVRWTVAVEVDELCNPRTIDLTKAIVSSDHSSGRKGKLHIVFVPEVKP